MAQTAYNYGSYSGGAVRRRRAPQQPQRTVQRPPLRVEKGGKRRLSPFQAAMHHAVQLLALALLAGFAVSLLWSESQLVELNDQIQTAQEQLISEQSQYTYYTSTLNNRTSLASVEETASRLGLMKIDPSQITYVRLNQASVLVRRESAVSQWTDFLHDGALMLVKTIRPAS